MALRAKPANGIGDMNGIINTNDDSEAHFVHASLLNRLRTSGVVPIRRRSLGIAHESAPRSRSFSAFLLGVLTTLACVGIASMWTPPGNPYAAHQHPLPSSGAINKAQDLLAFSASAASTGPIGAVRGPAMPSASGRVDANAAPPGSRDHERTAGLVGSHVPVASTIPTALVQASVTSAESAQPSVTAITVIASSSVARVAASPTSMAPSPSPTATAPADQCSPAAIKSIKDAYDAHISAVRQRLGHSDCEYVLPSLKRYYGYPTPGRDARGIPIQVSSYTSPPGFGAGTDTSAAAPAQTVAVTIRESGAPILIDVGANVGDTSSRMMHLYTSLDCKQQQARHPVAAAQPRCDDHDISFHGGGRAHGDGPIQVWAFEASPFTHAKLAQRGIDEGWTSSGWHSVNAAATAVNGTPVRFYSNGMDGDRQASMSQDHATAKGQYVEVEGMSLDGWAIQQGVMVRVDTPAAAAAADASTSASAPPAPMYVGTRMIHMLKIDAEGFDPAVLRGAQQLLQLGVPQFITFEYNDKWSWTGAKFSLSDTVSYLRRFEYLCFLITPTGLIPVSGDLWDERYEFKYWSNCLCGRREDVLWTWSPLASGNDGQLSSRPVSALPAGPSNGTTPSTAAAFASEASKRVGVSAGPLRKVFDALTDSIQREGGAGSVGNTAPASAAALPVHVLPAMPECAWGMM